MIKLSAGVTQWVSRPYMVMEYIDNGSLATVLFKDQRELSVGEVNVHEIHLFAYVPIVTT
jgi:hypothetical protein